MKKTFFSHAVMVCMVIVTLTTCKDDDHTCPTDNPTPVPFIPMAKGTDIGFKRNMLLPMGSLGLYNKSHYTVRQGGLYADFVKNPNVGPEYTHLSEFDVDFSLHDVICVISAIRSTAAHKIEITEILEYKNYILVKIARSGGNGSTVVSQPYHVVKIPATTKPVLFDELGWREE